jgi:hypothetical protein
MVIFSASACWAWIETVSSIVTNTFGIALKIETGFII